MISYCFLNQTAASLLEVAENDRSEFEALMKSKGCALIGKVTKDEKLLIRGLNQKIVIEASLEELRCCWKKTLSGES